MSWILLALGATLIWTIINIIDKFLADNKINNIKYATFISGITVFAIFLIPTLIKWEISLAPKVIIFGILGGLFYNFGVWLYYKALQMEEVSRFVPMLSMNTIFVAILAFAFLGERLSIHAYIGMFMIVLGTILISIKNVKNSVKFSSVIFLTLAITLFSAFQITSVKAATSNADIWSVLFWVGIGTATSAITMMIVNKEKISHKDKQVTKQLIPSISLSTGAYFMFIVALSKGPSSLVTAILASKYIFVFLLATVITYWHPEVIKEQINRRALAQKAFATFTVVVGVLLVI
ncbi:MAG: EamA family transporter [archaeon]|nr:EamA family transporter [Nanoarchaeota archaeon]